MKKEEDLCIEEEEKETARKCRLTFPAKRQSAPGLNKVVGAYKRDRQHLSSRLSSDQSALHSNKGNTFGKNITPC